MEASTQPLTQLPVPTPLRCRGRGATPGQTFLLRSRSRRPRPNSTSAPPPPLKCPNPFLPAPNQTTLFSRIQFSIRPATLIGGKEPSRMEKKLPDRLWVRPWRWAKTAFFLAAMLASLLLVCAPPLLVVLLDLLLPPALLANLLRAGHQLQAPPPTFPAASLPLLDQARAFRFAASLVDLPALSAARSLLILCAYTAFGGGAAYVWTAVACSVASLCYVLAKAVAMFGLAGGIQLQGKEVEAMFLMSLALAAAHIAMAYRATCRERRRLLVYRIDVEAVRLKGGQTPKGLKQYMV